jgi:hypothetical protein
MKLYFFCLVCLVISTARGNGKISSIGQNEPPHRIPSENPHANPEFVFNSTKITNDLIGDLSAQVLFAQSQIIPSRPRDDDRQPHLVSLRKTLIMVRSGNPSSNEPIIVTILNKFGKSLGKRTLNPPSSIPKTAYFTEGVPTAGIDFTVKDLSPRLVIDPSDIKKLSDPQGTALSEWLANNPMVEIQTADGRWTDRIYLPSAKRFDGKIICVKADATFKTVIHYAGRQVKISRGTKLLFKCVKGSWFHNAEFENNRILYAADAWNAIIPAKWITPGVSFHFQQGKLSGKLTGLKVGAPTQFLLHTIDIGMLTTPRDEFSFSKDPEAHREYFQTLPVSQLIVSQYAPLHLTEVMLPTGELLKESDPGEGGWHTGTMRQLIGKELISHGINNANYGLHSTAGIGEKSHPYVVNQITAHNNRGVYSNGVQVHGGSGGNGMVTLDKSIGNEFSHEVGHNFGLGHYVDGFKGSVHRSAGNINSTWGWDGDRNRFLPNFAAITSGKPSGLGTQSQAPFQGRSFGFDAMAGGEPFSNFNRFTLYTPNTASIIQRFLESKAVFDSNSDTGFSRWNPETFKMEPYKHSIKTVTPISVPIDDLGEKSLASMFSKNSHTRVNMKDGNWVKEFIVPLASEGNKGCILFINHEATYDSTMQINGTKVRLKQGLASCYISDGNQWNKGNIDEGLQLRKPEFYGVPVVTLVGYYDPSRQFPSYIYPPLHGKHGYCYRGDGHAIKPSDCHLVIETSEGALRFRLMQNRINPTSMNKFHVNVPTSLQPTDVSLVVGGSIVDKRTISPVNQKLAVTLNGYWEDSN